MEDFKKDKYNVLGELLVVVYLYGKSNVKWTWANDPKKDGLVTLFHTAVGCFDKHNRISLRNKAVWLSDSFDSEFTKTVERTAANGEKYQKDVVVKEKASDDGLLEKRWKLTKPTAEAILTRLKNTDDNKYRNMRHYYDRACAAFESTNQQPTQKLDTHKI